MKNRIGFLIGIYLTALLLGMITGCTKEKCVVCPPDQPPVEKEYYFLYSYGFGNWVYTYSTKTGQIVDSVQYPSYPFADVRFSKDGKYAYYVGGSIWITDFATGDTVAITEGTLSSGAWLSLSSDGRHLLLSGTTKLTLFEIPSLAIVYQREYEKGWDHGSIHQFKDIAYVGSNTLDSLLIIDFRASNIRDSTVPLFWGDGTTPTSALSAAVSKDGKTIILNAGRGWQLRNAETLELLREFPHVASFGPYLHPDGERVFFLQWEELDIGQPAEVWELNLRTFLMTRILQGGDFVTSSLYMALDPSDMDFTPDGKYAFIINGGQGPERGAILKLDCDTYKIIDAFYPALGPSNLIRINPREIKAGE